MGRFLSTACYLALSVLSASARLGNENRREANSITHSEIHDAGGKNRARRATGNPVDYPTKNQSQRPDNQREMHGWAGPPKAPTVESGDETPKADPAPRNGKQHESETDRGEDPIDGSRFKYDAHWKNYDGDNNSASANAQGHSQNDAAGGNEDDPTEGKGSPQSQNDKNNGYWIMDAAGALDKANYHTETHAEIIPKARKEEGAEVRNTGNERVAHGFVMFGWGTIFGGLVVYIGSVWNSRNDGRTITVDDVTEKKGKDAAKEGGEKGKANTTANGPAVMESITPKEYEALEDIPISGGSDKIMSITKGFENVPVNPFEEVPVNKSKKDGPVNQNKMIVHVSDDSFRLT